MNRTKNIKLFFNVTYLIGTFIVLTLAAASLLASHAAVTDSFFPISWKQVAFILLILTEFPMFLSCRSVWRVNGIGEREHRKRSFILIFLPFFISLAPIFFIIAWFLSALIANLFA